jgi:hypothetical protein
MKTVIQKQAVYGIVNHIEKTVYETEDGKQFDKEKDAIKHNEFLEYQKKFNLIKTIYPNTELPFLEDSVFYFASNQEELEMIIDYHGGLNQEYDDVKVYGNLKANEWITFHYFDGEDYKGEWSIYTLTYIKEQISKFLNNFKNQ